MYAFWEIIASNAVVATILAIGVMLLGRIWKNAAAIHALWVVVLLKLFTPPLVTAELPIAFRLVPTAESAHPQKVTLISPVRDKVQPAAPVAVTHSRGAIAAGDPQGSLENPSTATAGAKPWSLSTVLAAIWIGGACCTGLAYALRIRRFATVIRESEAAPASIRTMVTELSSRLGLRRVPDVLMTSRALPPLVWSLGFFPRVILPSELFARLSPDAHRTILAHELFHIRRGDDRVRLLELAAKTAFWWHPVVWWASRQLRELEEQCCDGRVLELVPDQPRTYAAALVDTLEFLSEQPRHLVPLRTAIDSAGSLSRRIFMLTQRRPNRLSLLSATLVAGLVAPPLAVAFAVDLQQASQPAPKGQPAAGAQAAVLRGRVTNEAGAPLADVRVRVAIPGADMRFVDSHTPHHQAEARTDANGDYRLEVPGITTPTMISIDAMKPGYRRLVGTLMSGGDPKDVEVEPGGDATASLILRPALYFSVIVVDKQGKPVPGVEIFAGVVIGRGSGGIERTASRADGTFELFNYPRKEGPLGKELGFGYVVFSHPDYIEYRLKDVYALAENQRETLRVILDSGHKVTGTVFDDAGKPVPHAMIEAIRKDWSHRKATLSDANGKFALRGLSDGLTMVTAHALAIKQKLQLPMALNRDKLDLEVRLKPMALPGNLKAYTLLGMQLTDVTAEWKSAYDLRYDRGALILDPGKESDRLQIGELAEGYVFWLVGRTRVGSVREFVDQLLAETAGQNAESLSVRVVYGFKTVEGVGTNTQYLKLTKDDRKQLQIVSDQLRPEED